MIRPLFVTLVILAVGGCIDPNLRRQANRIDPVNLARLEREKDMQDRWIGKSIYQVEASLGEPEMIMEIPGTVSSSVVLYGVLDTVSHCIDAFRVAHGETPTITNYFCR